MSMLKKFWKDKEKLYYIFAGIVFLIAVVLLAYFLYARKNTVQDAVGGVIENSTSTVQLAGCPYKSVLTGECVANESDVSAPLVGVMIEDFVDARPQAGIAEASVVYEAPAEGNITRFLAIFEKESDVKKVGPVRSARPYYLDFISEYGGAMYMHVGGSPDALEKISAYKILDVNEFYRGSYFWRDSARSAPHNVYTSSDLWKSAYTQYFSATLKNEFVSWNFSEATTTCAQNCIDHLEIPFLLPSYNVVWKYNADIRKYDRFHGRVAHLDSEGSPVRANTVVVQYVTDKILDDVGRRALGTIGSGKAEVYVLGNKIEGTWAKDSRMARTKFLDANGQKIAFAPGKIWIEVVPENIFVKN